MAAEEGLAACRRFFDRAVAESEEASVALYSLGDPPILARATAEILDLFSRWGLFGKDRRGLEIGCGIGRLQAAFAGRLRSVWQPFAIWDGAAFLARKPRGA